MKASVLLQTVLLTCFAAGVVAGQPTNGVPQKQEIWRLIPKSDLPFSTQENQNMRKVSDYGPAVLPILAELMREQADRRNASGVIMVSRIRAIAKRVEGDHEPILSVLRDLIEHQDKEIRRNAAAGIGEMGRANDAPFLLPLMTDTSEVVRVNAALALDKIGDADVATKMRRILEDRQRGLSRDEIRRDYSFRHGYEAISNIVVRQANSEPRKQDP